MDNGPEFSGFTQLENWGSQVYFAHPYTAWERPQNERHNGLFRAFVPKGVPIASFSPEYILPAADELNGMPRKKPGCRTPGGPFDKFPRLCLCSLWLQLHRPGCKPTLPSLTGALCD